MSRTWLLFLFCLFILIALSPPLSRASLTLKVNEAATRISFARESAVVILVLENSLRGTTNQKLLVELIDPQGHVRAKTSSVESVPQGAQTIRLNVPFEVAKLSEPERRQLLWYRLHYRLAAADASAAVSTEGFISLSEITPDLFELRIAAAEMLHEGMRYQARAQAVHPITGKPAAGVRVDAVLTLETDDDGGGVKLAAAGVTDAKGYALLFFDVPPKFPQFPHELRPAGGTIKVTGERAGLEVETEHDVLVDQFARMILTTDKPLYQPGQTLHLRVIALSPTRRALAGQDVNFRIEDQDNVVVFRETAKSSRFGIASIDWSIPENSRLGDYMIRASLGGEEDAGSQTVKVRISRYDLPNFSVNVKTNRSYYVPGQDAEVKVSANYLFGQAVARGHVRIVRESDREWNYKEQKWDFEEEEKYEGETDANGIFTTTVKLAEHHEQLADNDYQRFRDITLAAYFTDPTTNRTEQRRFDLRVTKNPIHVYLISPKDLNRINPRLPLAFYVSTFYADGSPARTSVTVSAQPIKETPAPNDPPPARLVTVNTNRYGLAKIAGVRWGSKPLSDEVKLLIKARDLQNRVGTREEEVRVDDDDNEVRLETDKSLYRDGEPIVASITSSVPDLNVVLEVGRDSGVISSQIVKLSGGRASITIPYRAEFQNQVTLAAYADFPDSQAMLSTRTVLYPRNRELKIESQPFRQSYRPGDQATVNFRVRSPAGTEVSALGLTITDRAIDDRFRTDNQFGTNSYGFYRSLDGMLGLDLQVSGVTLRDLQRLDLSKPLAPGLDLLAEILLLQTRNYYPSFFDADSYDANHRGIFEDLAKSLLTPTTNALSKHYAATGEYPTNEASLRAVLSQVGVDPNSLRDPWGVLYRTSFHIEKESDVISFTTAGPDKQFDTSDDFSVETNHWPYFRRTGETINRAVSEYHDRTGGFIRNDAALRAEVSKAGLDLGSLRDRWGQPYRLSFEVNQSNYSIVLTSSGPDQKFSTADAYSYDDFIIWTIRADYFAEARAHLNNLLTRRLKAINQFPANEGQLRDALRENDERLEDLKDPWDRNYYATFKVQPFRSDRVEIESRASFGQAFNQTTKVTPVTATATIIAIRSAGADGQMGTQDDFTVATFAGVLSEQAAGDPQPRAANSPVVFSEDSGAISGTVVDPVGAVVPGVKITATRATDDQTFSASTDDNGNYVFPTLFPGMYELNFEVRGFMRAKVTDVFVQAGNIVQVNVTLTVGTASETVTVCGSEPSVQTSQTSASIVDLPLSGRQFSTLRPGVTVVTKSASSSTPRLREYFPETLVWQPSLETDKQGRAQLKFKLADNITTWKMSVIASTEDGQIGTIEKDIKSFQPFFIEHDPPRILTEGDEISLPVVVRNYLDRKQPISLEIKPENWFSLTGPALKRAEVPPGDAVRETFDLRATASVKDGKQRLTAIGTDANDAIEKPVTVHPDGEEKSVSASDVVSENATFALDLPAGAIPGSTHAEVKIYPNLLAHVAESVEAIMQRPYGCGEQTISSTYPSLLLLRHNKQLGPGSASSAGLRNKADHYLHAGYNRLLNYRDASGGFTYWGRGEPDLALTAYALRFLNDAKPLIEVDDDVINAARAWLVKQQRADGSWGAFDYGQKIENERRTAMLTAYLARVLATTSSSVKPNGPVLTSELKHALDYLAPRIEKIDEPYLISSYALAALDAGDMDRAGKAVARLRTLAHEQSGMNYWSLETNTPFYGWGTAGRVETTALVVQALARYEAAANARSNDHLIDHGLLFLLREKDAYGVWYSTQATINVLDAMLVLLSRASNSAGPSSMEIVANGRTVKSVAMPPANQLVTPITIDLSQFVRNGNNQIELKRAPGSSPASAQAVATYYLPWRESIATQEANWRANGSSGLRLVTKFNKTEGKVSDEISCHVEAERIGFHGYGMMLAEIGLPPGADVDRASLEKAMKESDWSISQYDILPDRVVVYLWPRAGGTKFDFSFKPRFGLNAQTAASSVYDYYNPESRAVVAPARFVVR